MNRVKHVALFVFLLIATAGQAVTVSITKFYDAPCAQSIGGMVAVATGGTAPYSYLWSNGEATDDIYYLPPGSYTVTVTDANSETAEATEIIEDLPAHPHTNLGGISLYCDEPYVGLVEQSLFRGPAPYTFTDPDATSTDEWTNELGLVVYYVWYEAGGSNDGEVSWTDAAGCPASVSFVLPEPFVLEDLIILDVQGACDGNNGMIAFDYSLTPAFGNHKRRLHDLNGEDVPGLNWDTSPHTINNVPAGAYWLIIDPDFYYGVPQGEGLDCADSVYVEVPDISGQCAEVSGTVFIDHDQDCAQDGSDPGIVERLIEFQPGPFYAITNEGGTYSTHLPDGNYTLEVLGTGADLYAVCPVTQPVPITVSGVDQVVDIADSSLVPVDLRAMLSAGPARPGFIHQVYAQVRNIGGQLSGAVDVSLVFDPAMSFIASTPSPSAVSGNTITWSGLAPLSAFADREFTIQLQVPPDAGLIGSPYAHLLNAVQPLPENAMDNNTETVAGVFTGSFDPNDKLVRTSSGASAESYFIDGDDWLDYTIRFQNTGNDTAFTVVVKDSLSPYLDMGTFEQGAASDPFIVTFRPGRVVEWRFRHILLPDSGTNEVESHGLVSFRIKPAQPLLPGTVLSNTANIYFDFNPPVITEPSVLVAEFSTGQEQSPGQEQVVVYPSPAISVLHVALPASTVRLRILASDGRLVMTRSDRPGGGTIDVGHLPSGSYSLEVLTSNGGVHRARFIKQ